MFLCFGRNRSSKGVTKNYSEDYEQLETYIHTVNFFYFYNRCEPSKIKMRHLWARIQIQLQAKNFKLVRKKKNKTKKMR